jgi:hypothetical protein
MRCAFPPEINATRTGGRSHRPVQYNRRTRVHQLQSSLDGQENRGDVGAQDVIEILFQGLLDRTEFCYPGIGKQDVEMAEFVLDPVEKAGARLRIQNVGSDGRHTQLIRGRGERCRIAPCNCDTSAFGNKPPRSRKANPAIPARDQGTLTFQLH